MFFLLFVFSFLSSSSCWDLFACSFNDDGRREGGAQRHVALSFLGFLDERVFCFSIYIILLLLLLLLPAGGPK